MATYVLVHGGGHGGWCWARLAPLLRAAGHEVYTPTLTGLGERVHLLNEAVGLDTHITDVVKILHYEDLDRVILVGHSYGGAVITGTADRARNRVGHIVYFDASIQVNGEAIVDASPGMRAFAEADTRTVDGIELVLWPDNPIVRSLYGITDDATWNWMADRLTPHPWRCFVEKLHLQHEAAVANIPRTIINCTSTLKARGDRLDRYLSGERVWEIDTGHDLMITEPEASAEMLLRLGSL